MPSEVHPLRELCSLIADCPHSTPVWTDSGYIVIRNQNIKNGRLDLSAPSFTDAEHFAHRIRRAKPTAGDIIFTREAPMGEVCMVPEGLECCVGQRQVLLRPDPQVIDGKFLLYALQSPLVQHEIGWNEGTGSTVSNVRIPVLEALRIPTPPIEVQREVAETLGALDDKIALLRETNATLESIAQAMFKSWFVDFDPVRAKAEGRDPEGVPPEVADLFPSEFEDSALGEIPKGWQALPFGKLLNLTIGGDWGKDEPDGEHTVEVAIVRGTDMPDIKGGSIQTVPCRYVTPKKLKSRLLQDGDLIIEVSGGSKTQATGRSLYCTEMLLDGFGRPVVPASFCRLLRPLSREVGLLLAIHLSAIYAAGKMWNYQVQSTGLANFQTTHFLESELVVVPPEPVLKAFFDLVRPLVERQQTAEIRNLAALRDTLLPRLMSGKLRIPEIQENMEEVTA